MVDNAHFLPFFVNICIQKSTCAFKKQLNIFIESEMYPDGYFHQIKSCFLGAHTFFYSNLCLKSSQNVLKSHNLVNKVNFLMVCYHGNAINLNFLHVFFVVSDPTFKIHQYKVCNLILNFLSKCAPNAPTPLFVKQAVQATLFCCLRYRPLLKKNNHFLLILLAVSCCEFGNT